MSADKVKVCIVGAGQWGRKHARVFAQRSDITLCAMAGRSRGKTKVRAAEFGVRPYTNIAEMLEREKPDFVSFCLPNFEHFQGTMVVTQAGYPLLVEMPFAFELAEADRMLAEVEKRKFFFAINFSHRSGTSLRLARESVEKALLENVINAVWRFDGEARISFHPDTDLIETMCHGFDQLEYLCGPIRSVTPATTNLARGRHRKVTFELKFANGAIGSMMGACDSSYGKRDARLLEISGMKGRSALQERVRRFCFQEAGSKTDTLEEEYFGNVQHGFNRSFDAHLDAVLQAFRGGRPLPVHERTGRRALQLAWAAVESFESGKRVIVRQPV